LRAWLVIAAWVELLYIDLVGIRGLPGIRRAVYRTATRDRHARPGTVTAVVEAMKSACMLYFKPAKCLQRSAVVTRLLRRRGIDAGLVIGCHVPPLKAHAWVEVSGDIVSDNQDGLEYFRVLDRW
jgi:hypothetical protein